MCAAIPTVVCYYENFFKEASGHWSCSCSLRIPLESEPRWRLHLLLQLTTVKKQCAVFVTSPNRTPSCPNFRFPPTSTDLLTIPDIRMCLYRVTFKTWAGPGSFYTAWEALDQIKSAPGDSWDFWVVLKTNVFLKDVIAFDFVKISMSVCILVPNTESGGPLVVFIFSSPNFLLDLRPALYFGQKKKEQRTSCLNGVRRSRTTFPPSPPLGQKKSWFKILMNFICSTFSIPELAGSVNMMEKASLV